MIYEKFIEFYNMLISLIVKINFNKYFERIITKSLKIRNKVLLKKYIIKIF